MGFGQALAAATAEAGFGGVEGLATRPVAAMGFEGGGGLPGDGARLLEARAQEQAADAAEDRNAQPEREQEGGDHEGEDHGK